jgi:hypothetical protein
VRQSSLAKPSRAWLLLCAAWALACIATSALPASAQEVLRWDAALWPHLWGNLLTLAALAGLGHALALPRYAVAAAVLAWPLGTLALAGWPEISTYSGFSGLNHALVHVFIAFIAIEFIASRSASNAELCMGVLLALGLATKLGLEAAWHTPIVWHAGWGFAVVQIAHLLGAVSGLLATLLCYALARIFFTKAVVE